MIKNQFTQRTETFLFYFFLVIHMIPVLFLTPFVTLDGPAHLMNATIIRHLLFDQQSIYSTFLEFNPYPEPNWIGHILLAILTSLFTPLVAEKILLLIIILITAIFYRKLVLTLNHTNQWLSWFVFPYIYNFIFCLGFFNFCIGFALFPITLVWWINNRSRKVNLKLFLSGMFLLTLIYFSHLVMFLFTGFCLVLLSLNNFDFKNYKKNLNELLFLILIGLPGIIMSVWFVIIKGMNGYRDEVSFLPFNELLDCIKFSRMFIVYNYDSEKSISVFYSIFILIILFIGLRKKSLNKYRNTFLILLSSSLLMIFTIPDSVASGGILSIRIVQLFFICTCIYIATLNLPSRATQIFGVGSLIFSLLMISFHFPVQKSLSLDAMQYVNAGKLLEEGKIVAPLNYSGNWLHSNLGGYMAVQSNTLLLDNYEPTQGHFPLIWKENKNPESYLGNYCSSNLPCIYPSNFQEKTGLKVDYFTTWKKPNELTDSCSIITNDVLENSYVIQYKSIDLTIYRKN